MHLDKPEKRVAMRFLAALLAPGGIIIMSVRRFLCGGRS